MEFEPGNIVRIIKPSYEAKFHVDTLNYGDIGIVTNVNSNVYTQVRFFTGDCFYILTDCLELVNKMEAKDGI